MHASVFKCYKKSDILELERKTFAVKISPTDDIEKRMVFQKEFEITKNLNHKNIVKSIELFQNDLTGETMQVMEHVEGIEVFD